MLLDIHTLKKHDSSGMYKIYDQWPQIANDSFKKNLEPIDFGNISHIVFAGMGGSGALGDIFAAILSKSFIPVTLVKGYTLPKTVNSSTLVVATSVSGNTDETNTILSSAKKITENIIAFSSGGKMQKYCMENHIEHRKIPLYHSPRASFPSFLYSMLKVLEPEIPIEKSDVIQSIEQLSLLSKNICSANLSRNNPSLDIAQWVTGIPVIYYPHGLQAAATRFKNSLQENAKTHAISEDVIEACHNGIVPWEKPSIVQPILIQGDEDYYKTKERWTILKNLFEQSNINYKEIHSVQGNILTKLINLVYLLDYASLYRAVIAGTDPGPVKTIDLIKQKLSKDKKEIIKPIRMQ
jgi:glucose/mannose-6-phosphate isomerase